MARPIHTSNKVADMTKLLATHTPNRQATPTSNNPLPRNLRTQGDSNKGADMVNQLVLADMVRVIGFVYLEYLTAFRSRRQRC